MATTIILEAIAKVNADPAQKSIATLEQELEFLKSDLKDYLLVIQNLLK